MFDSIFESKYFLQLTDNCLNTLVQLFLELKRASCEWGKVNDIFIVGKIKSIDELNVVIVNGYDCE